VYKRQLPTVRADIPAQSEVAHLFDTSAGPNVVCTTIYGVTLSGQSSISSENICGTITGTVQKDNTEQDPSADYYALTVTLHAKISTSTPCCFAFSPPNKPGVWITSAFVTFTLPTSVSNLKQAPQTGTVNSQTQVSITFCAQGAVACLGASGFLPAQTIQFTNNQAGVFQWSVTESFHWCNSVLGDYADFLMIIGVPEGTAFNLGISARVTWTFETDQPGKCPNNGFGGYCDVGVNLSGNILVPDPDFTLSLPNGINYYVCPTASNAHVDVSIWARADQNFNGYVKMGLATIPGTLSSVPPGWGYTWSLPNPVTLTPGSVGAVTLSIFPLSTTTGTTTLYASGSATQGTNLYHTQTFYIIAQCGGGGGGGGCTPKVCCCPQSITRFDEPAAVQMHK